MRRVISPLRLRLRIPSKLIKTPSLQVCQETKQEARLLTIFRTKLTKWLWKTAWNSKRINKSATSWLNMARNTSKWLQTQCSKQLMTKRESPHRSLTILNTTKVFRASWKKKLPSYWNLMLSCKDCLRFKWEKRIRMMRWLEPRLRILMISQHLETIFSRKLVMSSLPRTSWSFRRILEPYIKSSDHFVD